MGFGGGMQNADLFRRKGKNGRPYRIIYFMVIGTILLTLSSSCAILASVTRRCSQEEFDAQVRQLIRNVSVSKERHQMLPKLLHAIEDTLSAVWPGSKASLLGSLAVGVGSPSSDADIAIHLPYGYYTTDNEIINNAAKAFENSPHYVKINIIESERISIINLYYKPENISCDISFKIVAAPYETELIKYLLNSDERVLKMAIIVKHWAKIHHITIRNRQSSLNIILLVIFFLQHISILPPVVDLQKNVKANILNASERYNVAFERKKITSENEDSLYIILGQFFEYYADFDFDKYIVSTFIGKPLDRRVFEHLERVPDDFKLYKINVKHNITYPLDVNTSLCIQTPFTPNNNCANKVDTQLRDRMVLNFKYAAKLYRKNNMCSFLNAIFKESSFSHE